MGVRLQATSNRTRTEISSSAHFLMILTWLRWGFSGLPLRQIGQASTWWLPELASHGGGLSGNEGNFNKDKLALPFEKRVFGTMQRWSPSLGEHLWSTFAVFRVNAIFSLDTNWSYVGCLSVSQQCKSKLPKPAGEWMVLIKIPVGVGGLWVALGLYQPWGETSVLFWWWCFFLTLVGMWFYSCFLHCNWKSKGSKEIWWK